MPELPEVEVTRKRCHALLSGQRLDQVIVHDDPIVFCDTQAKQLQAALQGQRVIACERKGKYFWWQFEEEHALVLHLGMTGAIHVPELPDLQLSHGIEFGQSLWPPRFVKLEIRLDNGQRLAFCDPRRFGRIRWQHQPLTKAPLCDLGVDPIAEPFEWEAFHRQLRRRRGVIKGLLLNQSFIAGIGNWIADEVLHDARIAPHAMVQELSQAQAMKLFLSIKKIIERAVAVDAQSDQFPEHWLFHKRWKAAPGQVDALGNAIVFCKIAGRSTAWVPQIQS